MGSKHLIADTSFYLFFLDDIQEEDKLEMILEEFTAHIPPIVYEEILKSEKSEFISNKKDKLNIFSKEKLSFGDVLTPLFSKLEKSRGEHEIIAIGFFCFSMKLDFVIILDDNGAVKFLKKNLPKLEEHLSRTANFIASCYKLWGIFKKDEVLYLLDKMEKSKFFIDKRYISKIKSEL